MCAVSAVTDVYRDKWPIPTFPQQPVLPFPIQISWEDWLHYQVLKKRMEEYDAITHQPDCVKPEVAEWEHQVFTHYVVKPEPGGENAKY